MITVNGVPLLQYERSQGYSAIRALHSEKPRIWLRELMQPGVVYGFDDLRTLLGKRADRAGYALTEQRLRRTLARMIEHGEIESVTPKPTGPRPRGASVARYRRLPA